MLSEIRKHRWLLSALIMLQVGSVMIPYIAVFEPVGLPLSQGWFADVRSNYYFLLLLLMTWFAAVPMVGLAGYWSSETAQRFCLEAWRHATPRAWIDRKIALSGALTAVLGGFVPFTFFLAEHPSEGVQAAAISANLVLYLAHLALLLIVALLLGGNASGAFAGVLAYHAANIVLDAYGLPNVVQYFLLGERASGATFIAALVSLCAAFWLLRMCFVPSVIAERGSDVA